MPEKILYANGQAMHLSLACSEDNVLIQNNTSRLNVYGYVYNPSSYTLFSATPGGKLYLEIWTDSETSGWGYWVPSHVDVEVPTLAGQQTVPISYQIDIPHKSNGELKVWVRLNWSKLGNVSWIPESDYVETGWMQYTSIGRSSELQNVIFGDSYNSPITVTYQRKNSLFREKIVLSINKSLIVTRQDISSGYSLQLSNTEIQSIQNIIKNNRVITYGLTLETWSSDFATKIGASEEKIKNYAFTDLPDVSVSTSEIGIPNIGVGEYETVSILSKKKVSVTAVPKYWADITSIIVNAGGQQAVCELTKLQNGSYTGTAILENLTDANYKIVVKDSRQSENVWEKTGEFKAYNPPNILSANVIRESDLGSTAIATIEGVFYSNKIGNKINSITISVTGDVTTTMTPAYSDNRWNSKKTINNISPDRSYLYEFTVTDAFGKTVRATYNLSISSPIMSILNDEIQVAGNTFIEGETITQKLTVGTGGIISNGSIISSEPIISQKVIQAMSGLIIGGNETFIRRQFSVWCPQIDNDNSQIITINYTSPPGYAPLAPLSSQHSTGGFGTLTKFTDSTVEFYWGNPWNPPYAVPAGMHMVDILFVKIA